MALCQHSNKQHHAQVPTVRARARPTARRSAAAFLVVFIIVLVVVPAQLCCFLCCVSNVLLCFLSFWFYVRILFTCFNLKKLFVRACFAIFQGRQDKAMLSQARYEALRHCREHWPWYWKPAHDAPAGGGPQRGAHHACHTVPEASLMNRARRPVYHLMQAARDGAQVDRPRREAHFSHDLSRTSLVAFEKNGVAACHRASPPCARCWRLHQSASAPRAREALRRGGTGRRSQTTGSWASA